MWNKGKQSISSGEASTNVIAGRDVNLYFRGNVPTKLVDQKTEEEVEELRKSRFFLEFDRTGSSLRLGRCLVEGDLSGGSKEVRGRALAWCARLLSLSEDLERAEEFLEFGKTLGDFTETKIAEAFIISQKGDKAAALNTLAYIDSNVSHSAGLMIVSHHDGAEGALSWMNDAGFKVGDLDSEGKFFVLNHQLQLGRWDEVAQTVKVISKADFDETPILHHLAALAKLVPTVPQDFRAIVLTQVPFEAREFPLASDAASMDARRTAHKHFLNAVDASTRLACSRAARMDDEFALWLELRDPEQSAHGKNRLENKLRDPNTALGFVRYAFQFGIKLDLSAVERDIERSIAINGGITTDAAIARFTLAFTQPTPEEAANYIVRHHNQLADHIDAKLMLYSQIEMLSRAGLIDKANEVLSRLKEEGIPAEQENNLRRIISETQGVNPIESRKAQYETTKDLRDLIYLVAELEERQHWDDLCKYGRRLFKETRALRDAERLVRALNNMHRSGAIVEFLNANSDLMSQSRNLQMSYAWGLYYEGALLESRAVLAKLSDDSNNPNFRALQVNLGIATGDWASLYAYVASEFQNREDRSAHDLMDAAKLALHLRSPHARNLVFEAATKAGNDASILAAAYFVATSAGWEDDPKVFQWLERAAELSGDDGPLQRMSLKDLLDRKPEWERRESETWRFLSQGKIPIFLAAQSLNRTLIDLTTFPALANLSKLDPRRRNPIPAYSGKRAPIKFDVGEKTVALDATALLTLSFLKILDETLDVFKTVYIPHSTLGWLFEEQQKAAFHQPSRIANARQVRDLLATDILQKFTESTFASSDLSAQVGDELAALIAEAEKVREGDDTQHIVVRSAPVHRLSSLMEEDANLSAHSAVLSSCLAVVSKLRQKGQITAEEEKRARAYLQLHEKPWPNQPEILDGATLYLDDLALTYLLHLGLLGKLKSADLRAVASPRAVSRRNSLISYERISNEVKDVIERVRVSLNSRIESGHVRVSGRGNFDDFEKKAIPEHPTFGIIALTPYCDAMIVDDRLVNQHANIDKGGTLTPIFSTLDLLDALMTAGVISEDDRLEYRTRLRRAGYFFVSVNEDELNRCLRASEIVDGEVAEKAELKAIRESILRVRMSEWLQLPDEVPWLDGTLKAFIRVLRGLWKDGADIDEVTACSNWLAEQIDVRGWAHSLVPENADNVVRIGRAAHILLLLTPPTGVEQSTRDAYWNWVEERMLAAIKEQFPDLYAWLVEWHKSHFAEMVETAFSEGDDS